jgi:hypothetical protein
MPVSQNDKEALIDSLLEARRKAIRLKLVLKFQGKNAEAKEVSDKADELSTKIDRLIAGQMRAWNTSAAGHLATIGSANRKLQRAIREVKNAINTAQAVVKATGYLDEAIVVAAQVAKKIAAA